MALMLAGSQGFTQLGVLIALGITFAGIFMMTVFFPFLAAENSSAAERLDLCAGEKLRALDRSPARSDALDLRAPASDSHSGRAFAEAANHLRCEHAFDGAETQRRRLRAQDHHGENAVALGAGHRHRPGRERATVARLLAESRRALERLASRPARSRVSPRRPRSRCRRQRLQTNRQKLQTADLPAARDALEAAIATEGFSRDTFESAFVLLDQLRAAASPSFQLPDWRTQLPQSSGWWFLVDRYFAHDPLLTTGFVTTNEPVATQEQKEMLHRELPVEGVPMVLSGWSFTLTDLVPWSHRQLILISALMAIFDATLLALLYRDWRLWLIQVATLAMAVCAMIASMKLLHIPLNLAQRPRVSARPRDRRRLRHLCASRLAESPATRSRRGRRGETGDSRRTDRDLRFRFARRGEQSDAGGTGICVRDRLVLESGRDNLFHFTRGGGG